MLVKEKLNTIFTVIKLKKPLAIFDFIDEETLNTLYIIKYGFTFLSIIWYCIILRKNLIFLKIFLLLIEFKKKAKNDWKKWKRNIGRSKWKW